MPAKKTLPFRLEPLDARFVPPKPKNSVEDSRVLELEKQGWAMYTRKRDGHYVSAVITNRVRLYTRGEAEDITVNFPHLANELSEVLRQNDGTLLCCELIAEKDGCDWRELVSSLTKSSTAVAKRLQEEKSLARLMVFNVLVLNGLDVSARNNAERIALVQKLFANTSHVFPVEVLPCSFAEAQQQVLKKKWEGLVVYDAQAPTAYRLHGNADRPPRPEGCWKRKPSYEDDFIAWSWESGTKGKRHENRMGKLFLTQLHPETGAEIPCGEVGIGFDDEEREFFANDSRYPCVVQVEYERRFPPRKITDRRLQCALCNPCFVRLRDDKNPQGCVLPEDLVIQIAEAKKAGGTS